MRRWAQVLMLMSIFIISANAHAQIIDRLCSPFTRHRGDVTLSSLTDLNGDRLFPICVGIPTKNKKGEESCARGLTLLPEKGKKRACYEVPDCAPNAVEITAKDFMGRKLGNICVDSEELKRAAHGRRVTLQRGIVKPAFQVMTLIYAPPGDGSEVTYGQGSTTGSAVDYKSVLKAGLQGSVTAGAVTVAVDTYGGVGAGTTFETMKEAKTAVLLESQVDAIDHSKDTFYLWTDPVLTISDDFPKSFQMAFSSSKKQANVIPVTVAELRDPSLLPDHKKKLLTHFQPSDFQSILALDPLIDEGAVLDPQRFAKQPVTLQINGPDHEGDPINGHIFEINNESTSGIVKTVTAGIDTSVTVETEFSFFGLAKVGASFGFSAGYEYEHNAEEKTGKTQTASVTLKTETVGFHDVYDVYFDTVFNTFAFVEHGKKGKKGGATLSGTVTRGNQPVADEPFMALLSDGTVRRAATDGRGRYRLDDLPPGEHQLFIGEASERVLLPAAASAQRDITLTR